MVPLKKVHVRVSLGQVGGKWHQQEQQWQRTRVSNINKCPPAKAAIAQVRRQVSRQTVCCPAADTAVSQSVSTSRHLLPRSASAPEHTDDARAQRRSKVCCCLPLLKRSATHLTLHSLSFFLLLLLWPSEPLKADTQRKAETVSTLASAVAEDPTQTHTQAQAQAAQNYPSAHKQI